MNEELIEEIQNKIISFANDDDYKEHQALFKIGNIEKLLDINRYLEFTNTKLQKENKILKENAEHNDKVVDKVNWENKHYKHIIDELEKWLRERKEYYKSLHSQRVYAFNDTLIKLQELKGSDSNE